MRLFPTELHLGGRPSLTAEATLFGRALELRRPPTERIVSDALAPLFLGRSERLALDRVTALGPLEPLARSAERGAVAAIGTSSLCRHRFIDAALLETLPEVAQIVILGAGYDTRAHRFARAIGQRPVFEVDLAPLSRRKAAIVSAHAGRFAGHVERVETDFRSRPLSSTLVSAGVRLGAPTFVAWEGVTMYLDRSAVRATLADLAEVCGPGSTLAMDFWQDVGGWAPVDLARKTAMSSLRLVGEPICFTASPQDALALLADAGFDVVDQADALRMTSRFATDGRRCDEGMHVVAARR